MLLGHLHNTLSQHSLNDSFFSPHRANPMKLVIKCPHGFHAHIWIKKNAEASFFLVIYVSQVVRLLLLWKNYGSAFWNLRNHFLKKLFGTSNLEFMLETEESGKVHNSTTREIDAVNYCILVNKSRFFLNDVDKAVLPIDNKECLWSGSLPINCNHAELSVLYCINTIYFSIVPLAERC